MDEKREFCASENHSLGPRLFEIENYPLNCLFGFVNNLPDAQLIKIKYDVVDIVSRGSVWDHNVYSYIRKPFSIEILFHYETSA